jgi:hypothetical protein
VNPLPRGPWARRSGWGHWICCPELYSCRIVPISLGFQPTGDVVLATSASNKGASDSSLSWMDLGVGSSVWGRRGGGGVLGLDFCSPAPPSQWCLLRRYCGAWESVQGPSLAGQASDGQEDDVICTSLWTARRQIWRQSSTTSMECVRSGARRLARGEAPTDEPQRQRSRLRRATFEVLKAAAQRWSSVVLGYAGISPPFLWWLPGRRRRRAAVEGFDVGTSKDVIVIFSFLGVLSAFVRVIVAFLAAFVRCVRGMYSIITQ